MINIIEYHSEHQKICENQYFLHSSLHVRNCCTSYGVVPPMNQYLMMPASTHQQLCKIKTTHTFVTVA